LLYPFFQGNLEKKIFPTVPAMTRRSLEPVPPLTLLDSPLYEPLHENAQILKIVTGHEILRQLRRNDFLGAPSSWKKLGEGQQRSGSLSLGQRIGQRPALILPTPLELGKWTAVLCIAKGGSMVSFFLNFARVESY
jgi:hypothetical protein